MPLSMTIVLILFYAVFASQILLISVYYPEKLSRRVEYVVKNFPPSEYPKLYPASISGFGGENGKRRLLIFRGLNWAIAAVGVAVLLGMALSGYRPDLKGGDEIFVGAYFFLQTGPLFYVQLREHQHLRAMRKQFADNTRKADLNPLRLFDFISPAHVVAAALLYAGWLAFYMYDKGTGNLWESEVIVTLLVVTGVNLIFAAITAKLLYGKKQNPYQAHSDRLREIESTIKVMLMASIGMNVFLTLAIAADRYSWEVLDPPLVSLYLQLSTIFGIGFMFESLKAEAIDFEVYRQEAPQPSS